MRHVLVIMVNIPAMMTPQVTKYDILTSSYAGTPKYRVSKTPHPIYY